MHGVIMIFFFLIPSIPAVLGNFLLPIMIGAQGPGFPPHQPASWYIYMIGGCSPSTPWWPAASTPAGPSTRLQHDVLEHAT